MIRETGSKLLVTLKLHKIHQKRVRVEIFLIMRLPNKPKGNRIVVHSTVNMNCIRKYQANSQISWNGKKNHQKPER